jgi:hypothetical protein
MSKQLMFKVYYGDEAGASLLYASQQSQAGLLRSAQRAMEVSWGGSPCS